MVGIPGPSSIWLFKNSDSLYLVILPLSGQESTKFSCKGSDGTYLGFVVLYHILSFFFILKPFLACGSGKNRPTGQTWLTGLSWLPPCPRGLSSVSRQWKGKEKQVGDTPTSSKSWPSSGTSHCSPDSIK